VSDQNGENLREAIRQEAQERFQEKQARLLAMRRRFEERVIAPFVDRLIEQGVLPETDYQVEWE